MSNFIFKAKNKKTGEIVEVLVIDDYFGKHAYGYKTSERVYDEFDFDEAFEKVEHKEEKRTWEERFDEKYIISEYKEADIVWNEHIKKIKSDVKEIEDEAYERGKKEVIEDLKEICNRCKTERGLSRAISNYVTTSLKGEGE